MRLEVNVYSENAQTIQNAITEFFQSEWDVTPEVRKQAQREEQRNAATIIIGVIGLILILPQAALATLQVIDLIQRKKLRDKIVELQNTINELSQSDQDSVQLKVGENKTLDLCNASSEQIVEALIDESKKAK